MWRRLKRLIFGPQEPTAGKTTEAGASAPRAHPCYAARDEVSRWQGDLYAATRFPAGSLPAGAEKIPCCWFYSVGYDDEQFKTKSYLEQLTQSISD
jgi:hypothetical protein